MCTRRKTSQGLMACKGSGVRIPLPPPSFSQFPEGTPLHHYSNKYFFLTTPTSVSELSSITYFAHRYRYETINRSFSNRGRCTGAPFNSITIFHSSWSVELHVGDTSTALQSEWTVPSSLAATAKTRHPSRTRRWSRIVFSKCIPAFSKTRAEAKLSG